MNKLNIKGITLKNIHKNNYTRKIQPTVAMTTRTILGREKVPQTIIPYKGHTLSLRRYNYIPIVIETIYCENIHITPIHNILYKYTQHSILL